MSVVCGLVQVACYALTNKIVSESNRSILVITDRFFLSKPIYIYKDTRKHWPQRSLQVEPPPKRPTGWRPHQPNQLCWGCLLMVSGRCGHLEKGSDLCCETDAPSFLGANGPHVLGEERRRGAFLLFGSLVANGMKWIRTCISTASIKLQRPRILLQSAVLHRRRCLLHFLAGFLESPET